MKAHFIPLALALALVSCQKNEEESSPGTEVGSEPVVAPAEWPVTRGGGGLSGRIAAPVPGEPRLKWRFESAFPIASEAVFAGGKVIFGNDGGELFCLDTESGGVIWQKELPDGIEAACAIHEDRVFVPCVDGFLYALALSDGSEIWKHETRDKITSGVNVAPAPDGEGVCLFFNGYDGTSRCLSAADGSELWRHETDKFINGTPAIVEGKWVVFGGCDQKLYTLDLASGELVNAIMTEAEITSTVATDGKLVVVGNYGNQVLAAQADGEATQWIYTDRRFPFMASPAIGGGLVFAGCRDKNLHAIARDTGEGVWKFRTGGRIESSPVLYENAVVFGSSDGRLYALAPKTGEELWRVEIGESLIAAPAGNARRIFIGGEKGGFYCLEGS
ncbi:MAG: PQQ-binding-like beta-propeller repeat protein [Verrucomicrobiales bacterium]